MINAPAKLLVAKNFTLPTLPTIVQKVSELLANPDAGTREIADLVAQDPPLAAKILKIANSSYYGLRERCLSTAQASTVLGTKVLRSVVTQAAVISQFDHLKGSGFDLDALWRHSITTGQVASMLARRAKKPLGLAPEEIYTCGLLHDLGKVVILQNAREAFLETVQRSIKDNVSPHLCERKTLGFDHTDVGALVATQWHLPESVAAAIQFHHGPRETIATTPIVSLIANANLLVEYAAAGNRSAAASTFDGGALRLLGFVAEDVTDAVTFVEKTLASVEV